LNVLILAPFCSLPGEPYFNRFQYLAHILSASHQTTLVTSSFRHFDKQHRKPPNQPIRYELVLLDEPGYARNVSLHRLLSHAAFCRNFRQWFDRETASRHFDVVYSAFPLIGTNIFLGSRKPIANFKLLIDVQDTWPESISSAVPSLARIPPHWLPFSWRADRAYRAADGLVAVSESYLKRAVRKNDGARRLVVYIGGEVRKIAKIDPARFAGDYVDFVYLGTLSHSYDVETVVRSFNLLAERQPRFRAHILGAGPDLAKLRKLATGNIRFYGMLPYEKAIAIAKGADVLLNPIMKHAAQSVTNKLSDYLLLGKPIINSQTNAEVVKILEQRVVRHYGSGDIDGFIRAAESIVLDPDFKRTPASLLEFDREITYPRLVSFIESFGAQTLTDEYLPG
jgi:glycosyltransferase involved in cell wall biosynthesis